MSSLVSLLGGLCLSLVLAGPVLAQCVPQVTTKRSPWQVTFTAPPATQGLTWTGYQIDLRVDNGPWTPLATTAPTVTAADLPQLDPGHVYEVQARVMAKLPDGSQELSAPGKAGSPPPCVQVVLVPAPENVSLRPKP